MQTDDVLSALTALSHPSRLAAFRALVQAGPSGLAVGEVRERLELAPATLSAHLNVLRAAGLVSDAREGRVIRMRADYARMDALVGYLMENCCGGQAQCAPAACAPGKPAAAKAATRRPAAKTPAGSKPAGTKPAGTKPITTRTPARNSAARKAAARTRPGARK
jgi:ArsR family transcriptional regulator